MTMMSILLISSLIVFCRILRDLANKERIYPDQYSIIHQNERILQSA